MLEQSRTETEAAQWQVDYLQRACNISNANLQDWWDNAEPEHLAYLRQSHKGLILTMQAARKRLLELRKAEN